MISNLLLVVVCLVAGFLLRRTGKFPESSPKTFNAFVIWISFPALVLVQLPALLANLSWNFSMLIPVSMPWIQFGLSYLLFSTLGKRYGWNQAKTGALVLTAGLGNTSFVGFPLLEALLGPQAVAAGLVVDQLGSFLTLSTVGILYASLCSPMGRKKVSTSFFVKRVIYFPPFIALVLSLLISLLGLTVPFLPVLERLAGTLVPLALVSVGFQIKPSFSLIREQSRELNLGLTFKLILVPAFFCALYLPFSSKEELFTRVTLLQSAMAPMITAGVLAEEFGFDPVITNLMLGIGIPLSLVSVPLWNLILS